MMSFSVINRSPWRGVTFFLLLLGMVGWSCTGTQSSSGTSSAGRTGPQLRYDNYIYEAPIRTVQLYQDGYEGSYPVLYIDRGTPLRLEFDELIDPSQPESSFWVEIVSCNANWEPSNLLPIEFYEGISQEPITIYNRSEHSKINYVHYEHTFPQQNEKFKLSGNYLLKVYRNPDPRDLVLTRRFVVVDRRVAIGLVNAPARRMERLRLSELTFRVNVGSMKLVSPERDLQIKLLQNFRWDNTWEPDRPRYSSGQVLEYYVDLLRAFEGGQEFRRANLQSTYLLSETVRRVKEYPGYWEIWQNTDRTRLNNDYPPVPDFNGQFIIRVDEWPVPDIHADYLRTHFRYDYPQGLPADQELYVFGALTDWQTRSPFRMKKDPQSGLFETEVLLKQGVYDYTYVIRDKTSGEIIEGRGEGRKRDEENFYSLLVYFRGPTDRNDRIIGFLNINYLE